MPGRDGEVAGGDPRRGHSPQGGDPGGGSPVPPSRYHGSSAAGAQLLRCLQLTKTCDLFFFFHSKLSLIVIKMLIFWGDGG